MAILTFVPGRIEETIPIGQPEPALSERRKSKGLP